MYRMPLCRWFRPEAPQRLPGTSITIIKHLSIGINTFRSSTTALKNDRDNDNALNLQNYAKILFEIAISIHDASSLNI